MDKQHVNPRNIAWIVPFSAKHEFKIMEIENQIAQDELKVMQIPRLNEKWEGEENWLDNRWRRNCREEMRDTNLDLEKRREESAMSEECYSFSFLWNALVRAFLSSSLRCLSFSSNETANHTARVHYTLRLIYDAGNLLNSQPLDTLPRGKSPGLRSSPE